MRFPILILSALLTLTHVAAQEQKPVLDLTGTGPAQRIWSEVMLEVQELWFRRTIAIPKGARMVRIVASCDNSCTIFVNGQNVGTALDWENLTVIDLETMRVGDNTIAVHAKNRGGPAALVLWMTWIDAKGNRQQLGTDKDWRVSRVGVAGWEAPGFDDSKWKPAKEQGAAQYAKTVYGGAPRKYVFVNKFADAADVIEKALEAMRSARKDEDALRALNDIERAIMRARRSIRDNQARRQKKR